MIEFSIIMKILDERGINMFETNVIMDEIKQFQQVFSDYFSEESKHVARLATNKSIITFLSSCNSGTNTIENAKYQEILSVLKETKASSNQIYLTFVGIDGNGDQIDNFGISRQQECRENLRDDYVVTKRAWYIETLRSKTPKETTITLPYRDVSGSYVISITKAVSDQKGKYLGVVGLDVLVRNIALRLNTTNHIVIITESGEIVYNSETYIRDILEDRHNILLLLQTDVLDIVKSKKIGYTPSKISSKDCMLGFACLLENKYYLISIYND